MTEGQASDEAGGSPGAEASGGLVTLTIQTPRHFELLGSAATLEKQATEHQP